jgi:DNA-binding response OmpR family regulator
MDYMMPGMDGLETFKAFRKLKGAADFAGRATPVIALSGEAQKETREALMNAGFADYLVKPVSPQELEDAIRKWLPEELVQAAGTGRSGETIPSELEAELGEYGVSLLETALGEHGVSLKEALEYNMGNLELVYRTAEILVQNYDERKSEMTELIAQGNWDGLRYLAHNLKSTLRSIGAANAADTALRLELYCKKAPIPAKSAALIKKTAALLFTEWEEAINGYRTHN